MPRREHRRSLSHASGRNDHDLVMVVELVESVTQRHRAYRASSGARLECGSWCAWPRRRRLARPRADSWSDCAVFGWHRVWPERTSEDPNSISQVSRPRELRPLDAPSACSRSTRSDRMSSSFRRARGSEPHPSGFARAGEVSKARIERRECSSRFDMNSVEDGGRGMIEARLRHLDTLATPRPSRSPPRRARLSAAALPDPRGARHCLRGPPRRHRRR